MLRMFPGRLAIMLAVVVCATACGRARVTSSESEGPVAPLRKADDQQGGPPTGAQPNQEGQGEGNGFSLSIPPERWPASQYCGPVTPPMPQDTAFVFPTTLLNTKLAGEGLLGWIHAAVPYYEQYVFTYRNEDPNDEMAFFHSAQFTLVPATAEIARTLAGLKRHDKVRLKGSVFENGSPITHLYLTGIEVVQRYPLATENNYPFDLALLRGHDRFQVFGQLHAIVDSQTYGRALLLEHDNLVMPLAVPAALDQVTSALYRGDIVNAAVKVVVHAGGPPHFELDAEAGADAFRVIDPMLNCHGLSKTVSGFLVKFNKSPAISRDIYAIRVVDANGIGRNITLFHDPSDENFPAVFNALAAKAQAAWEQSPEVAQVGRNYHMKPSLKIAATGVLNVVATEQANAQVFLNSPDDMVIGQ